MLTNELYITFNTFCTCVAFEGFVLYAGGDYTLYPSIMLLVQVMAYVMSGMIRRRYSGVRNMPLEPGPLIGSTDPHGSAGAGKGEFPQRAVGPELLKRQDVFVHMGINQDNVNC